MLPLGAVFVKVNVHKPVECQQLIE
jgi:hypothetical protein